MVELLNQPGPAWPERIIDVDTPTKARVVQLTAGLGLFDALCQAVESSGYPFGSADYFGGRLVPLSYCIPADATCERAVNFSEPRATESVDLMVASAVIGIRHGERFVHTHGSWLAPDGQVRAGHLFPESIIGDPPPWAVIAAMPGVRWLSDDDPETNMPTFTPFPTPSEAAMTTSTDGRAVVARVLPNEQVEEAIAKICLRNNLRNAYIRGGSGSIIGAVFDDGSGGTRVVEGPATEIAALIGLVTDGEPNQIHAVLVDKYGQVSAGALMKGANHVAVTLEVVLQEIEN